MRIMYLSYWGLNEGLTQSSVLPHLKILSDHTAVSKIHFLTIERGNKVGVLQNINKVTHTPLYSWNFPISLLNKVFDFVLFRRKIVQVIKRDKIDQIICRSSLAGAIGYLVSKRTKTPFIVESFEPHADYMLDAGVWSKNGMKYRFQKHWEDKIIRHASAVITVSKYYAEVILSQITAKVYSFGCAVDIDQFTFNEQMRHRIRKRLNIDGCLVGIYVGKFGDIYYREEAYTIFKSAFEFFGEKFRLIILTPNSKEEVMRSLKSISIDTEKVFVDLVPHTEVPEYLSAADFAFSMVRPAPVRMYCSPIKDGEYWANGLPVLSADGIGEDSDIIKSEDAGAIFSVDLSDLTNSLQKLNLLVKRNDRIGLIREVAFKYRNFEGLKIIYADILKISK